MISEPLPDWILCSDCAAAGQLLTKTANPARRTHHPLPRNKEIADRRRKVVHPSPSQRIILRVLRSPHDPAHPAEEEEVLVHRRERDRMQDPQSLNELVRLEQRKHRLEMRWRDLDLRFPLLACRSLDGSGRGVRDDGNRGEEESLKLLFLCCWWSTDDFE